MAEVYYHTTVAASGAAAAAREIQVGRIPVAFNVSLNLNLNAQADLVLLNPPILSQRRCSGDNWQSA
jgi:hypothetical protein